MPDEIPHASQPRPYASLAVLGGGAWGTALAATAARAGVSVTLWCRDAAVAADINETRMNTKFLPNIPLPDGLVATTDMSKALTGADAAMLVVPSKALRLVCNRAADHLPKDVPVAICAKGIERDTGLLMTQVAEEELGRRPYGVVSGPTFAHETALCHLTAATVAFPFSHRDRLHPEESPSVRFAVSLTTEYFRAYISDDLEGVEIGGAVKNVIAIACGMMTGAGFAENTRAALITRGVDEMKRLAEALGGRAETVSGLSGVGDLTLTCSSQTSRNMSLGVQLGKGLKRHEVFDGKPIVVEGEENARSVTDLARRLKVSMPICETVRSILHDGVDIGRAFADLWARPLEAEPATMDLALNHPADPKDIADLADRIS